MAWYEASEESVASRKFEISDLTPRQIEILTLAADGFSGKQIARRLGACREALTTDQPYPTARTQLAGL